MISKQSVLKSEHLVVFEPVTVFYLIIGFILLTYGAELLVRGASNLAYSFGISSLVVGLTVVAFGTSLPELAVSVKAAWVGQSEIALGNVVGSNILNVLLILGLSALVLPLIVANQLVKFDVPVMIGLSLLVYVLGLNGTLDRTEGIFLTILLFLYCIILLRLGKTDDAPERENISSGKSILFLILGLSMLVFGSRLLVSSAVEIAKSFGVSELVIGLTLVAFGTSLPEIVTSVIASIRGERDIAVGNIVGSNIFNILAVLGISSTIGEIKVSDAALAFDIPIMIAVAVACFPIFFTGTITRKAGAAFLFYYFAYTTYLLLNAKQHELLDPFSNIMMFFFIPLTVFGLGYSLLKSLRKPL